MPAKQGKKNRKYGRKAERSSSQKRYTSEKRWEKNKKRKAQKRANKTAKPIKIKINEEWVLISPNNR
jgi:hypothetical protein